MQEVENPAFFTRDRFITHFVRTCGDRDFYSSLKKHIIDKNFKYESIRSLVMSILVHFNKKNEKRKIDLEDIRVPFVTKNHFDFPATVHILFGCWIQLVKDEKIDIETIEVLRKLRNHLNIFLR